MINFKDFNVDLNEMSAERNGITLDATFLNDCAMIYERLTTAAYVADTYEFSNEKSWKIADLVREKMADCPGLTEEDAIDEAIDEYK